MDFYDDLNGPFGMALNEANLLGVILDEDNRSAKVGFDVLALPEGPEESWTKRRRVTFTFSPVGRVAASLRNARWDDSSAGPERLQPSDLLETIRDFGCLPIYGWEFFDLGDTAFAQA